MKSLFFVSWLAFALSACGGSGGSTIPPGSTPSGHLETATLVVHLDPARTTSGKRRIAYLSPSMQAIAISVTGASTVQEGVNLTTGNPNCTTTLLGGLTCTISFALITGSYLASFTTYDQPYTGTVNGTCSLGPGATCAQPPGTHALSQQQNLALMVVSGKANTLAVTLSGIPAKIALLPYSGSVPRGRYDVGFTFPPTSSTTFLTEAFDADDNAIVGPGAPSFSYAVSDGSLNITATRGSEHELVTLHSTARAFNPSASLSVTATTPDPTACPRSVCQTAIAFDTHGSVFAVLTAPQVLQIYEEGSARISTLSAGGPFGFDGSGVLYIAGTTVATVAPPWSALPTGVPIDLTFSNWISQRLALDSGDMVGVGIVSGTGPLGGSAAIVMPLPIRTTGDTRGTVGAAISDTIEQTPAGIYGCSSFFVSYPSVLGQGTLVHDAGGAKIPCRQVAALDANGVYLLHSDGSIGYYALATKTVTTTAIASGATSIAADAYGNLIVATAASIVVYAPPAQGPATTLWSTSQGAIMLAAGPYL
jgi:hypothetical protein